MWAVTAREIGVAARPEGYRWRICALLFFATTMNYVDRQALGVLAPELQRTIGWNEIQYASVVTAFQAAYAMGLLFAGGLMDRVGARMGYGLAIAVWSLATIGHALARTVLGFGIARFALGLGEGGHFPAAIKTVAEWFPTKERTLATGIFNAGSNIGALVAAVAVPWLTVRFGWQSTFLVLGLASALWVIPWVVMYRPPEAHPRLSARELAHIQSGLPEAAAKVPWRRLLGHRATWAFLLAKFLTDPIWWFFMFWLPKFLNTQHGLSFASLGWPLVLIYSVATLGSVAGGWLPARAFKLGWSVDRARKASMLTCALAVVPILFAAKASSLWVAVGLVSLATAAHQGWSANLFTLVSDCFPRHAVGSVVGIGGFGGAVGGMVIATFTGLVLQFTGSYVPMFVMAGSAYLVALLIIHVLVPRLGPVDLERAAASAEGAGRGSSAGGEGG
jgi:ACS family hexuronate transporter-like MFS transporter